MLCKVFKERVAVEFIDDISELSLSVTIGVATTNADESNLEALIKRADDMLYVGKRSGRDQVVVCRDG